MTRADSEDAAYSGLNIPWQTDFIRFKWLAFGFVAILFLLSFNGHWRIGRDSATYRGIARNLVRSHQYVFRPRTALPRSMKPLEKQEIVYPGTPLLLAGVERIFGEGDLAPQLVMYGLAAVTLLLVFRLLGSILEAWVAVAVVFLLGTNRLFIEHANELLSDLPFLLGLIWSLWGFEKLRRARGRQQWVIACLVTVVGLGIAISTRPTALILALAWVIAGVWGILWPERVGDQRRRSPYGVALGLLAGIGVCAYFLDPRTRAAGFHLGGYEQKVHDQLAEWKVLLKQAYERSGKTFDEHIPACFFAFAVKQSSSLLAKAIMAVYSLMVIGAGIGLVRVNRLWGIVVLFSVVCLSVLGDNPRYYLMILPLLLMGWCLFCASVARWLGPDRQRGHRWADRLFGWAPQWPMLPRLAMLWGLGILVVPNVVRDMDLIREQRGLDRHLHFIGFENSYADGKELPLVRVAEMIRRATTRATRILGPEPTILTYLSDRQVFDLDRMTGRHGRGWRDGLAALNLQMAVFPPRKAALLYGDRDPIVCEMLDRHAIVSTHEVARTVDGVPLCDFTTRVLMGEHLRGGKPLRYRVRQQMAATRPSSG